MTEYEKRKVKSIAKDDVQILHTTDKLERRQMQKLKQIYQPLLRWITNHAQVKYKMEKTYLSQKLATAPLFIFTSQYGYSAQMEKIQKAQAFSSNEKSAGYMAAKKSLEINPAHPVIKKLLEECSEGSGVPSDASIE